MKLKTTKSKVTRFLQTFVVTPLFLLPPFLFFVLQLSDYISVDILPNSEHANDIGGKKEEGGGCVWIHCPLLLLLFVSFFFSLGGAEVGW